MWELVELLSADLMPRREEDMTDGSEIATQRRPYAATANILGVLSRVRSRNLPASINGDFLRIAGIGDAVHGRVNETLVFLDLITPDGTPTERLRTMVAATEAEYRQQLAACLRDAYVADFQAVNPEADTQQQVVDAFRRYEPRSQTPRMVMLFLGLCRAAGIAVREAPRDRAMQPPARRPAARTAQPAGGRRVREVDSRGGGEPPSVDRGLLFGVTEADLRKLSEEEFDEVWTALGKVAKTVTRARTRPTTEASQRDAGTEGPEVEPE